MPGQATVTINENQWEVSLATTYTELTTGLSGLASMPAGMGMLFVLPADQPASVTTEPMLFNIDIIFISSGLEVVDVARNIAPGNIVTESTPVRYFLEVNAGEAGGVDVGDIVTTATIQQPGFDLSSIISFAIPVAVLGFVCAMAGGMAKLMGGSSSSSEVRRLGKPRTEEERARVHEEFYGTKELPPRGMGLREREELTEGRRLGEPKTEAERRETHERKYGTRELPPRGTELGQKEEETRFIGGCKVAGGLCHTHGYSVSKTVRCPKSPLTDEEWAAAWELAEQAYPEGMSNPWVNGWWPETMEEAEGAAKTYEWKMRDAIRMFRERQRAAIENYERGADKAIYNYRRYVIGEYERGRELSVVASPSGHHSMWLTLEQRKDLQEKYGMVAVRWAEEATKPGDIKAAEAAAEYYYKKLKEALGLGHLSPELSEEQMRKLREVLGLEVDVAEILKIHRETGYIQ